MRRMLLAAFCLWPVVMSAQPQVAPGVHQARWDYGATWVADYKVTRFEFCLDPTQTSAGTCSDVGLPSSFVDAQTTPNGIVSYAVSFPAMTMGAHSFAIRACNAAGCGASGAGFAFVVAPLPPTPSNLGIVVR